MSFSSFLAYENGNVGGSLQIYEGSLTTGQSYASQEAPNILTTPLTLPAGTYLIYGSLLISIYNATNNFLRTVQASLTYGSSELLLCKQTISLPVSPQGYLLEDQIYNISNIITITQTTTFQLQVTVATTTATGTNGSTWEVIGGALNGSKIAAIKIA